MQIINALYQNVDNDQIRMSDVITCSDYYFKM
jgi:hypothetical protein